MTNNTSKRNSYLVVRPDGSIMGKCFLTPQEMDELAKKAGYPIEETCSAKEITEEWWKKNKSEIKKNIPALYDHLDKLYFLLAQKDSPMFDFEKMLSLFHENLTWLGDMKDSSADNYCSWLRRLNNDSGGSVVVWIIDGLSASKDSFEREDIAWKHFDDFAVNHPMNGLKDVRSAFRKFVKFFMSYFDGNMAVSFFLDEFELANLVARTAIFASRDVVDKIKNGQLGNKENQKNGGNIYASWDHMMSKRGPKQGNKRPVVNGIKIDDNSGANKAIKQAVLESLGYRGTAQAAKMFRGFEACHIWESPRDNNYYQSIMNLVLVPRPLAALTDHNQYVKDVLTYRAYNLYGPLPLQPGKPQPTKPKNYNKLCWRKC